MKLKNHISDKDWETMTDHLKTAFELARGYEHVGVVVSVFDFAPESKHKPYHGVSGRVATLRAQICDALQFIIENKNPFVMIIFLNYLKRVINGKIDSLNERMLGK